MKKVSVILLVFLIVSVLMALPIQASPDTFGETSQGGNLQNLENSIRGSPFTCPEAGTGVSITAWLEVVDAAHDVKCRLYNTDGSIVANGDTEEINVGVGANQEVTFDFNTAPTLANQDYVIVAWSEGTTGTCKLYSFAESDRMRQDNEAYDGWPDPATFVTYHQRCSIYCTYTPSGAQEENFYGSVTMQFGVNGRKTVAFSRYGFINPTFTINSVREFTVGQILNLFGAITLAFSVGMLKSVIFNPIGVITVSFMISSVRTWVTNILNLFGSIGLVLDIEGWTSLPSALSILASFIGQIFMFIMAFLLMILTFLSKGEENRPRRAIFGSISMMLWFILALFYPLMSPTVPVLGWVFWLLGVVMMIWLLAEAFMFFNVWREKRRWG